MVSFSVRSLFGVLVFLGLLAVPGVCAAQGDPQEEDDGGLMDEFALLEEAEVVELPARHKQDIGMSPSAVTVITREDIETSGASTIPDLLRLVPGMDVILTAPSFTAVQARLYWINENWYFQVLVDGRDATSELMGTVLWPIQPISLDDIERIEVIRGPGSALYGANAMAGVISITTRSVPKETSAWARVEGGEVGSLNTGLRAATRLGSWGFSLSGGVSLQGSFNDFRAPGKQALKLRSVVEYRLSERARLLLDAGIAQGEGPVVTGVGTIEGHTGLRAVRLAYESPSIEGQVYWSQTPVGGVFQEPLVYNGVRLAEFDAIDIDGHTLDGEIQWRLPDFWEPLMVLVGGVVRYSWLQSDQLLDASSYPDITSNGYHEPGIDYREHRLGSFLHAELSPAAWVTVTGGARFDYNNVTGFFASPRLAAVLQPTGGQFVRAGVSRAFRKPAFVETDLHPMVTFPADSPITGPARQDFQEFMTRVIGAHGLDNEELLSGELGYMGRFLDDRLTVALDLYYTRMSKVIDLGYHLQPGEAGLPDLERSSFAFYSSDERIETLGGEFTVRYQLHQAVSLLAVWSHRQVLGWRVSKNPKNLITLGGRFRLTNGLLGSLYLFSRSEFDDYSVPNPKGLLEPAVSKHMPSVFLLLGKLGWRWEAPGGLACETGIKLFLPVSPFSAPHWGYHEAGGGVAASGRAYGGEMLRRIVSVFLEGSY